MHELLVSRGFVRRPTPLNSSDEDGGVSDKTSKAERPRVDAATAERKLESTQASAKLESTGRPSKASVFPGNQSLRDKTLFFIFFWCFALLSGDNLVFASRSRIIADPPRCGLATDTRTQHHLLQHKVICIHTRISRCLGVIYDDDDDR